MTGMIIEAYQEPADKTYHAYLDKLYWRVLKKYALVISGKRIKTG